MKKILTIIIPTYNAEKFLDKGLQSFVLDSEEQMEQLEVLIVNDGSTDQSTAIAQKYVERYPNTFQIVNKENGGHGSAINAGAGKATGKYFKVIDADDWVEKKALQQYMKRLEKEEYDAIIQSFIEYDITTKEYQKKAVQGKKNQKAYTLLELMELWDTIYFGISFHGITYNTAFYQKLHYQLTEGVFYEDQEYATIPLCYAKNVGVEEEPLYVYRVGDVNQSVSAANQLKRSAHFEKVAMSMIELENHLTELPEGGKELWEKKVSMFIGSYYQVALIKNPKKRSYRKQIKEFNQKIEAKSPYIYARIKNKYRVFQVLNYLHMSNEVFEHQFAWLLRTATRILHVNKLYA